MVERHVLLLPAVKRACMVVVRLVVSLAAVIIEAVVVVAATVVGLVPATVAAGAVALAVRVARWVQLSTRHHYVVPESSIPASRHELTYSPLY